MMTSPKSTLSLATRGSALALAQAHLVLARCRESFPQLTFELNVIKTTGDKLQGASLANPTAETPKGLFTKELEVALLEGNADLAVHSLKDLPTDLPQGLHLGATPPREDPRDVLIYRAQGAVSGTGEGRAYPAHTGLTGLAKEATVATSSTRRQAQLMDQRPDLRVVPIRGNVGTRMRRLKERPEWDAIVLAAAGLHRLGVVIHEKGELGAPSEDSALADAVHGLFAAYLGLDEMLPCVGQAAIGIEVREEDEQMAEVCGVLNDAETFRCVTAERSFLQAMGGGCLSPLAALADQENGLLRLRAVSFRTGKPERAQDHAGLEEGCALGRRVAAKLGGKGSAS